VRCAIEVQNGLIVGYRRQPGGRWGIQNWRSS
jgi:hypothetical protein